MNSLQHHVKACSRLLYFLHCGPLNHFTECSGMVQIYTVFITHTFIVSRVKHTNINRKQMALNENIYTFILFTNW